METTLSGMAAKALPVVNARSYSRSGRHVPPHDEAARRRDASGGSMHDLLRRCAHLRQRRAAA